MGKSGVRRMGEMGWVGETPKTRIKGERYGESGVRHMGEMGGWAKLKKQE